MEILQHPKQLWILAFGNLWDTFSYLGTQTLIVLYLTHIYHYTDVHSYLIYGAYAAFAFSLPALGGIIGDRYIGCKKAMLFGGSLSVIGNLILFSFGQSILAVGLSISLVGSGLYKGNSTALVGLSYQKEPHHKESAFLLFYLAINLGGTLGPLTYGLVIYSLGWNYGFLCSVVGILIGYIWFISNYAAWRTDETRNHLEFAIFLIIFFVFFVYLVFSFINYSYYILPILFLFILCYILLKSLSFNISERKRCLGLLLLFVFAMFYFSAGLQIGSSLNLFIQSEIQKGYISFPLPSSTFSSLYCLFVIILAPFLVYTWKYFNMKNIKISPSSKVITGIFLAAVGVLLFSLASITHIDLELIVLGILFLSAGELVLAPAVLTLISDNAPIKFQGTMMGLWFLFIALGGYLSSVLDVSLFGYFNQFITIFALMVLVGILLLLFRPLINKLLLT